jgi:hypothetical protein
MGFTRSVYVKIHTAAFYSLLGFMLQGIVMNHVLAFQYTEDKKLEEVKIKLSRGDVSLEQAFRIIEQQSDFKFFYIKEDVPLNKSIKTQDQEETLYQLLQNFAKVFGLAFSRINNQIVVKKDDSIQSKIYNVSGVVRDGSTNEPLVYANILIEGTQQGTITDAHGRFTLALSQGRYSLRCSYVGYQTKLVSMMVPLDNQVTIPLFAMDVLLQDVTVYAHRQDNAGQIEVSDIALENEKIKNSASLIPDVLRSVQMLPGVSANNEFSAKFNVRGGNQDENLVLVNGTQVYDPFHIKEIPNISIGIFNMDMIRSIDFMTGGFPARYGDKMSSVLNIEYRDGSRDHYKGIASLSLTDFNTVLEGPIGNDGSFIIGGRKTYYEYLSKMLKKKKDNQLNWPSFYDFQSVFGYSLGEQDKVMLKFIHAGDEFGVDPTAHHDGPSQRDVNHFNVTEISFDSLEAQAHYYSTLLALQSIHIFSSTAVLKTEFSFYDQRDNEHYWHNNNYQFQALKADTSVFYFNERDGVYQNNLEIKTLELNSNLDLQVSPTYGIKTGMGYQHIYYDQDLISQYIIDEFTNNYEYPDTTHNRRIENMFDYTSNDVHTQSYKISGYLENVIQISDPLVINIGGRFDYFDLNKDLTWSPRINIAYRASADMTLRGAWGYYYQSPIYRQIAYSVASDTNTHSQRAIHYVLGTDYNIINDQQAQWFLKIKIEGYYKKYDDLISMTLLSNGLVSYSRRNDAYGMAKGFDMYIAYAIPRCSGWISYSYLNARQTLKQDTIGSSFPRNTDQRHTLAMMDEINLGSGWSINPRLMYGSGYPYTPFIAVYDNSKNMWGWISGKPNSDYLPAYKRLDLRIAKDFEMFGKPASVFLDVNNVFNARNIMAYSYHLDNSGNPVREEVKLWPILPTLGMSVRF